MIKRIRLLLSVLLCLCLLLPLAPVGRAYSLGDPWQVDLSGFLKNETNREYTEMMLDYYLRTDEKVRSALEAGGCAMFFFEGCSDNTDDPSLSDLTFFRVTSLCIVVKLDDAGKPYIIYYNPHCSTIPDRPLEYGAWSFPDVGFVGPATICDGTYELYSVRHMGQYEALHMRDAYDDGDLAAVYMTPEGYVRKDANSINIHTRTSNHTITRGMWSAGCMLVGDGDYSQFLEMMQCTYYAVHELFELDKKVGTVTIDRQYLKESLYGLYQDKDAVDQLLARSRNLQPEAYLDACTTLDTYENGKYMQTRDTVQVMTLPCSNAEDARSRAAAELEAGTRVSLLGEVRNPQGDCWYELEHQGQRRFVSGAGLEAIPSQQEHWLKRFFRELFR